MRLDTLWKTLSHDERESLAVRAGLRLGYLRLLGGGHKKGCSLATVLALVRADKRLTADELVEEFSAPIRDARLPPKPDPVEVVAVAILPVSDDEARANIAQVRLSAKALSDHADALEAWNAARPAYAL